MQVSPQAAGGEAQENALLLAERVAFCKLPLLVQQAAGLGFQATHIMDRDPRIFLALFVEKYVSWEPNTLQRKKFAQRVFFGARDFPGFYKRFPDFSPRHPKRNLTGNADIKRLQKVHAPS